MIGKHKLEKQGLTHPFKPVFNARSKILVLGSFPSVNSRENEFYYGHQRNRFWPVLATLFTQSTPETIPEKTTFLYKHSIALWDVVASCTISGSADSTLIPLTFNDIASCLCATNVKQVFANGHKAGKLYQAHLEKETGVSIRILPSTSPANAAWTLAQLITAWQPLYDAVQMATRKR